MLFAAVHESAFGTKRTYRVALHMSAFGSKADIAIISTSALNSDVMGSRMRLLTPPRAH